MGESVGGQGAYRIHEQLIGKKHPIHLRRPPRGLTRAFGGGGAQEACTGGGELSAG